MSTFLPDLVAHVFLARAPFIYPAESIALSSLQ